MGSAPQHHKLFLFSVTTLKLLLLFAVSFSSLLRQEYQVNQAGLDLAIWVRLALNS